ncbi:sperm microtubule inner protein 8 isoform X2 [Pelobates fuscus]|uniref:sperm microtubule inner protein 8 isoform X2 n=1 Tax=Pelobates fuscus TaxID=191477 RepID=UPI002FE4A8A8
MLAQDRYDCHPDGPWGSHVPKYPVHKLAGVKQTLYHPLLPTLRRMEMDTMRHKLSDEHSRTTTPCSQENFRRSTLTFQPSPEYRLPALGAADTGNQIPQSKVMSTVAPTLPGMTQKEWLHLTSAADDWSKTVSSCREFQLRDVKNAVLGYSGYAVQFLSPDVTSSWRYWLHHNPSLDRCGQKPVPVETLNTFRTFGKSYRQL